MHTRRILLTVVLVGLGIVSSFAPGTGKFPPNRVAFAQQKGGRGEGHYHAAGGVGSD